MDLIRAKVEENEEALDSAYSKVVENEDLTRQLKNDPRVEAVLGSRIPVGYLAEHPVE
jgi:hypothetical protein